MIKSYSTYR